MKQAPLKMSVKMNSLLKKGWIVMEEEWAAGGRNFLLIGHLHDGVILLQLPECITNFVSYSDFYSPLRIVEQLALIT